ncbi:MAG: hypothetical protein M3O94_07415 [Actinomycetota bacterium]|nr:hypothetical protein [Actinomycetota bacterium]
MGDGTKVTRLSPVPIGPPSWKWREVAGTSHTCAVRQNGFLYCWGSGYAGQLGTGDTEDRLVPTRIGDAIQWQSVTAGSAFSCAVALDASGWCWGDNTAGELGTGDRSSRLVPARMVGRGSWSRIVAGSQFTCGARTDGTLWCWGYGPNGQLGIGDIEGEPQRSRPAQVEPDVTWMAATAGTFHACAQHLNGKLQCWGANFFGQLGDGTRDQRTTPHKVHAPRGRDR